MKLFRRTPVPRSTKLKRKADLFDQCSFRSSHEDHLWSSDIQIDQYSDGGYVALFYCEGAP